MILVIADDITGAAEIAGIALRHNLNVQFITNITSPLPETDVVVIATDTRSGDEAEAMDTMNNIADNIKGYDITVFKKTDSVLRGFVVTEISALMTNIGVTGALLIPQNPSKGRIIQNGRYYINETPLDQTSFCYDPEFPAKTSYVEECLPGTRALSISESFKGGICIADASNSQEIEHQLGKVDKNILIAGAADCFEIFLKKNMNGGIRKNKCQSEGIQSSKKQAACKTIVVCGSTQSKSLINEPYIKFIMAEETTMPHNVFNGAPADRWIADVNNSYNARGSVIITVGHPATGGKDYAIRLRGLMASATSQLIGTHTPDFLIIEGGATAFSILNKLGWESFVIEKEFTPGVVCMKYNNTHIILKPGSYPWGNLFKSNTLL